MSKHMVRKWVIQMSLLGCMIGLLAACGGGNSSTSSGGSPRPTGTATPRPTGTTVPAGTVLYQAKWDTGLASWQGTRGWKVAQGQLETVTSTATLAIPYTPKVNDYAVEVHLQIVRALTDNGGYFSIYAKPQSGKNGYQAGVSGLKKPGPFGSHPQSQAMIDPSSAQSPGGYPQDYEPGSGWHDFRVEVRSSEVRLLVDGVQIGDANSNQTDTLSNGPLGINSDAIVLRVSSLQISAL